MHSLYLPTIATFLAHMFSHSSSNLNFILRTMVLWNGTPWNLEWLGKFSEKIIASIFGTPLKTDIHGVTLQKITIFTHSVP